ncbi:MAG: chromosomal replication initiator DnaA [Sphingomonadaceae bacterium]|nr:chromosomal replication initiator DnaA [Sphingomonadaceae bacterium]
MNQIALPLDWPADEALDAFLVSPSNAAAVRHLDSPAKWPVAASILTGPRKSGRSLLGRIFAARTGGQLIDNAEGRDETAIFHAWNAAQASRRPLLLIADAPPPEWRVRLPDLRSRLSATPVVTLGAPDEPLIAQMIPYLLGRRGLACAGDVGAYVAPRLTRCHHSVIAFADALDAAALAQRRAITVPLAREVLERSGDAAA